MRKPLAATAWTPASSSSAPNTKDTFDSLKEVIEKTAQEIYGGMRVEAVRGDIAAAAPFSVELNISGAPPLADLFVACA